MVGDRPEYLEGLHVISRFLNEHGGVEALADRAPKNAFSLRRFLLEQVFFRNIVACLTSSITESFIPTSEMTSRFLEAAGWSANDREWESFERMFGESTVWCLD